MLKIGMLISRSKRLMVSIEGTSRPPSKYATGNFQVLEISMAVILAFSMETSMAHGKFQVLEISRAHGNFHGPWKIPWPMEISMGGLISPWTGSVWQCFFTNV